MTDPLHNAAAPAGPVFSSSANTAAQGRRKPPVTVALATLLLLMPLSQRFTLLAVVGLVITALPRA